ncbi:TPM domain-containing protein [Mycobacterium sp. CPCC 205372]|uniref:TPM domain-containing protein n=1 Tax=Mycobacterium hippophais TaxID=3016340 RepID=A0ABT4PPM4_9MYCO|nr:TPM domain-containing protein [Mycobacterium hippophais]MCZ8378497.1 TPM domain-containing protein [Mycobacterium hippophais]
MRFARLLSVVCAVLTVGVLIAPNAAAEPPFRVPDYVTDNAGALDRTQRAEVQAAVDRLYDTRGTRLWVVYVDRFGQDPVAWADTATELSDFGDHDALLAIAVVERSYAFRVPTAVIGQSEADRLQRNEIEPMLRRQDWAGAAITAAQGLDVAPPQPLHVSPLAIAVVLVLIVAIGLVLWWWQRRRRRKRRAAEFEAAKRVDPTDPNALAAVPIDALDDLSKAIVVDVDNAVRTSDGELAMAVGEFGPQRTEPFVRAVATAKAALAQAFSVRQTLDDAIPEAPLQRRDLLTRVIVSAATADRELDAQSEAFEQLRDLVINAPDRLDTLTQQMVDLTARIAPAEQTLAGLRAQFDAAALSSVAGNIDAAKERLAFADRHITSARALVARPAGDQIGLVDAVRAAESALAQARQLFEALDSAAGDINRAVASLPAAIADLRAGIAHAGSLLQKPDTPQAAELTAALKKANDAVRAAEAGGPTDPLGTFTALTKADADLDRLLASVHEQREAAERLVRALDQAVVTAQSRIRAVSDFIDTRRGSIGPEARTRLAEAGRQLEAAQAKRSTDVSEAVAHANGASMLAAQAQSLANDDVQAAQQTFTSHYPGGGSDLGAVIGGIIIGNVLRGGFSGGVGTSGWSGGYSGGRGMGRSTSFGGSSRSSGRSYSGGGGRF